MSTGLMAGKRGLIMGLANDKSIAWGIAQAVAAQGAELAFSYQGEALKKRVEPLAASLGRAELLFQELLSLEVGDTIRLDAEISQPLKIKVNSKTKFLGQPGIKDGRMATRVIKVLEEGDEDYDE